MSLLAIVVGAKQPRSGPSSAVGSHFDEYKEQTRVKHQILSKYLKPYFEIRGSGGHDNLVYIDAFAGAGQYKNGEVTEAGSPVRALETFLLTKSDVREKITPIFIEFSEEYFAQLKLTVEAFDATSRGLREPVVVHGTFAEEVNSLLEGLKSKGASLAPSFLFADPCSVDGLDFATLSRYLLESQGEAFLFFNYSGVSRIAGTGYRPGKTLSRLLGSDERAAELVASLETRTPAQKEEIIISAYMRALGALVPDLYVTAFRIEFADKKTTSHYLIHLTRNDLVIPPFQN